MVGRIQQINITDSGLVIDSDLQIIITRPTTPVQHATAQATLDGTTGEVSTITVTNPGSHYLTTPSVAISSPESAGKQAIGTAILGDSGDIVNILPTSRGKFYKSVPSVVISAPTGDSNKQATLSLQYDSINDKVSGLTITNPGKLYDSSLPPTITISAFDSVGGSNATATATVVNSKISSILITDSGSGYTSTPTVTISAPTLSLNNFTTSFVPYNVCL